MGLELCEGNVCEGIDLLPGALEVEVFGHGARDDQTADLGGEGCAQAVEGVLEDEGVFGRDPESLSGVEEEAGIGFDFAGVVDGGDVFKSGA